MSLSSSEGFRNGVSALLVTASLLTLLILSQTGKTKGAFRNHVDYLAGHWESAVLWPGHAPLLRPKLTMVRRWLGKGNSKVDRMELVFLLYGHSDSGIKILHQLVEEYPDDPVLAAHVLRLAYLAYRPPTRRSAGAATRETHRQAAITAIRAGRLSEPDNAVFALSQALIHFGEGQSYAGLLSLEEAARKPYYRSYSVKEAETMLQRLSREGRRGGGAYRYLLTTRTLFPSVPFPHDLAQLFWRAPQDEFGIRKRVALLKTLNLMLDGAATAVEQAASASSIRTLITGRRHVGTRGLSIDPAQESREFVQMTGFVGAGEILQKAVAAANRRMSVDPGRALEYGSTLRQAAACLIWACSFLVLALSSFTLSGRSGPIAPSSLAMGAALVVWPIGNLWGAVASRGASVMMLNALLIGVLLTFAAAARIWRTTSWRIWAVLAFGFTSLYVVACKRDIEADVALSETGARLFGPR